MPFDSFLILLGFIAFLILCCWLIWKGAKRKIRKDKEARYYAIQADMVRQIEDHEMMQEIADELLRRRGETP